MKQETFQMNGNESIKYRKTLSTMLSIMVTKSYNI
jgi:hypothetical protein